MTKSLGKTKNLVLVYNNELYNAIFKIDKDDYKSQLGQVFCLNGSGVHWKGSMEETIVDSIIETEYIDDSDVPKR